ncbi:hypothetical protein [Eupransor demetentiae]|uniref:Uncharacterized protein n=1 Tax=Eupransor demetentiae TaxID=3109584 RepID=A0ABM9N671_9LACO|nr:hypothetical protein R54876_GBNLAHCA_01293 [Lactobacillaceae bacterium LMG 33000]
MLNDICIQIVLLGVTWLLIYASMSLLTVIFGTLSCSKYRLINFLGLAYDLERKKFCFHPIYNLYGHAVLMDFKSQKDMNRYLNSRAIAATVVFVAVSVWQTIDHVDDFYWVIGPSTMSLISWMIALYYSGTEAGQTKNGKLRVENRNLAMQVWSKLLLAKDQHSYDRVDLVLDYLEQKEPREVAYLAIFFAYMNSSLLSKGITPEQHARIEAIYNRYSRANINDGFGLFDYGDYPGELASMKIILTNAGLDYDFIRHAPRAYRRRLFYMSDPRNVYFESEYARQLSLVHRSLRDESFLMKSCAAYWQWGQDRK